MTFPHEGAGAETGPDPGNEWTAWNTPDSGSDPAGSEVQANDEASRGYATNPADTGPTGSPGDAVGVNPGFLDNDAPDGSPEDETGQPTPDYHPAKPAAQPEQRGRGELLAPVIDPATTADAGEDVASASRAAEPRTDQPVPATRERPSGRNGERNGTQLELPHPDRNLLEASLRGTDAKPGVSLTGAQADGATMLLGQVRAEQLAEEAQRPDERETRITSESERVARVREKPDQFPQVVTEEVESPLGAWGELIAAKPETDKLIGEFAQQQREGVGALWGALNWTHQERIAQGLSPGDVRANKNAVVELNAELYQALGAGDVQRVNTAFAAIREHVQGMADDYSENCRRPNSTVTAMGWQQPIRTPETDRRFLRTAAVQHGHLRKLGGAAAADKLLPAEFSRRAGQLNEDAQDMVALADPEAFQQGAHRGPTPLEPVIRDLWAQGGALEVRAAEMQGGESEGLGALSGMIIKENERRSDLADRERVGERTVATGGLGPLSDVRLYGLIQSTAAEFLRLKQTEGDETARSFLAVASQQAQNLVNGRATHEDLSGFVAAVNEGTFTRQELLAMGRDLLGNLEDTTAQVMGAEGGGQLRGNAQAHYLGVLAGQRAALATDRDGTLQQAQRRAIETDASGARQELLSADRRWLVITGDTWRDDGKPDAFVQAAAASGQLVGLDGMGLKSPLADSAARDWLQRVSGGRTTVNHIPLLDRGRQWDLIAIEGDPSRAQVDPDDVDRSLLAHIAPNGACAMPINLTARSESLTERVVQAVDPWYFDENATGEGQEFAGQFRWAPVPTSLIRPVQGADGRLRFLYGHANPQVAPPAQPVSLYLFRNKPNGEMSDLCQQLLTLNEAARQQRVDARG